LKNVGHERTRIVVELVGAFFAATTTMYDRLTLRHETSRPQDVLRMGRCGLRLDIRYDHHHSATKPA